MDVHKESIEITLAEEGGELRRFGQIGGERAALMKAVRKLPPVVANWCLSTRRVRADFGSTARSRPWGTLVWWSHQRSFRGARAIT
jgi:hypothetical protein